MGWSPTIAFLWQYLYFFSFPEVIILFPPKELYNNKRGFVYRFSKVNIVGVCFRCSMRRLVPGEYSWLSVLIPPVPTTSFLRPRGESENKQLANSKHKKVGCQTKLFILYVVVHFALGLEEYRLTSSLDRSSHRSSKLVCQFW